MSTQTVAQRIVLPSQSVAIREHSIPVATDRETFDGHLQQFLQGVLPAIIIRPPAGHGIDPLDLHKRSVVELSGAIRELIPGVIVGKITRSGFQALGQSAVGLLHHDSLVKSPKLEPFVHTVASGGGKVHVARVGTDLQQVIRDEFRKNPEAVKHPHYAYIGGIANPSIMSPDVYTFDLEAGDTLIAATGGLYTDWHRMDTDQSRGQRRVYVTDLRDTTQGFDARSYGEYDGFQLSI